MLNDKDYDELMETIMPYYREIENELIVAIAKRFELGEVDRGDVQWWLSKLQEMGGLDRDTVIRIAKLSNKAEGEVYDIIKSTVNKSIDMKTFTKAYDMGQTLIDPRTISLANIIELSTKSLTNELSLAYTNALDGSTKDFNRVINKVYLEQQLGIYDYNTSIIKGLTELADKGITTATYERKTKDKDGKEIKQTVEYGLESAVRRIIMTGITQASANASEEVGNQLGAKHWAVSQHLGARSKGKGHQNHMKWQGDYYTMKQLRDVCGYGEVDGLCGVNCRHTFDAYFPGISPPIEKPYDNVENERIYNLTQKQRGYEREIRKAKRRLNVAQELEDEDMINDTKKLIRTRQARLKSFIDDNSDVLKRDYRREKVIS